VPGRSAHPDTPIDLPFPLTRRGAERLLRGGLRLPPVERALVGVWLRGRPLSAGQESIVIQGLERLRALGGEDDREDEEAARRTRERLDAAARRPEPARPPFEGDDPHMLPRDRPGRLDRLKPARSVPQGEGTGEGGESDMVGVWTT